MSDFAYLTASYFLAQMILILEVESYIFINTTK